MAYNNVMLKLLKITRNLASILAKVLKHFHTSMREIKSKYNNETGLNKLNYYTKF